MVIKINSLILLLVSLFGFIFCYPTGGKEVIEIEWQGRIVECMQYEVLIKVKEDISPVIISSHLIKQGFGVIDDFDKLRSARFVIPENYNLTNALAFLETNPHVEKVAPNVIYHLAVIPDDEYFSNQWGLHNTGGPPNYGTPDADIDAPEGWEEEKGDPSIKIGILDTGIPLQDNILSHPDLNDASRIQLGTDFTGDGEGVKDNVGHGTHIAGIIGAESNNGIGVAGMCWGCELRIVQVFRSDLGGGYATVWWFYQGVMEAVDNGCEVLNYSGGGGVHPWAAYACAYARDHDCVLVAAAGNNSGAVCYPAAYSIDYANVIAVAGTDKNDNRVLYSSYGPEINVAAPAGGTYSPPNESDNIYSTTPNYSFLYEQYGLTQTYSYMPGTSVAAPFVTGLAGLIRSKYPDLTAAEVRNVITHYADDLGAPGFDPYYGWGRINVKMSLWHDKILSKTKFPKMSAFNNSTKVVMSGNNVYIVYVADQYWAPSGRPHIVYCLRSTDGGNSFIKDELGIHGYIADYPSIALDDEANPHVVWGAVTKIGENYYRKYFYSTFDGNNWTAPQPIYGNYLDITDELTEEHLCPPSFIIKGDSGFVAWQENYDHNGNYNGLNLTTFELSNPASTYATHGIKHGVCFMGLRAPSIGYDPGGRLVLAYATWWDQACAYGDINFIYREPNGNWSDPVLIGNDQAVTGIPSLCTRYGRVYIAFQHLLNNDNIACATLSWLGGDYTSPAISFIAQLDPQGQVPFSAFPNLINENLVIWRNNDDDIYYSQRAGATWTTPENISNTAEEVSSYPQGVIFGGGSRRRLLCLWTEESGANYYMMRDIIDLPQVCPYIDVAQSDIPEATGYNNSQRLLRDANNVLHIAFTSNNSIYHTSKDDTGWSEPVLVGTGKYPSLSLGADGKIYCTYSFHGYRKFGGLMYYVEYLMTSTYDGEDWSNPSILFHTYGSFLWGVGAPSMAVSDTMAYVTFKSYHGPHPHPAPGTVPPHIIVVEGPALIYGKFPVNNASAFTYEIIDTIIKDQIAVDTLTYRNSLVPLLISPSLAVDLEDVKHILWEGDSTQMRYYTIIDTSITCEFFDSEVDYPWLTMNGDRIDLFWTTHDSIRYRYGWTGTPNLSSSQTVATCESPISSDQYLTWTKQSGDLSYLYYGAIPANGVIAPIEVDYSTNSISYPQILYNPQMSNKPASIDLVWTDYDYLASIGYIYHLNLPIEEPAPIYAFDMGTETPVPVIVQRDGYLALGPEDFQTFDYDSTELIYHMTLHSPHKKYKIRWTYYHEESDKLKLQFNIDDILHHNHWVEPGEIVTGDAWIPQACLNDNEITIKVKKLKGTIAVLSGIEIFVEEVGGGGPQSAGVQPIKRFFFESMYPNPTKGILKIRFNSPDERKVTVKMYDVVGRLAETIFDGKAKIGMNEFLIMPKDLSAGVYFIRLKTEGYTKTEKVILLR